MSSTTTIADDQECLLGIRLHDGTLVKAKFKAGMTLTTVAKYVIKKAMELGVDKKSGGAIYHKEGSFEIHTVVFPKIIYSHDQFATTKLRDVGGLIPSGSIAIVSARKSNVLVREEGTIQDAKTKGNMEVASHRLKGDSFEEKERFKKEQNLKEIAEKQKEKHQKQKELERVRNQIEADKQKRKEWKREDSPEDKTK